MYVFGRRPAFETKARKNRNNCNRPRALGWIAVAYFVSFTVFGGLILLTLFVGVVATSMSEASEQNEAAEKLAERCMQRANALGLSAAAVEAYRRAFDRLDQDARGKLTYEGVKHALRCQRQLGKKRLPGLFLTRFDLNKLAEVRFQVTLLSWPPPKRMFTKNSVCVLRC